MPRFFTDIKPENQICLTGADAAHITGSLRMKIGNELIVCSDGVDYKCRISQLNDGNVMLDVLESSPCLAEPDVRVTLYQALPKSDKMDFIIQKAVELGVSAIVPVLSARCISRPEPRIFAKKLERFNRIALEAAKQSGRGFIPQIDSLISFSNAIKRCADSDCAIILYEKSGAKLADTINKSHKSISVFIGSEGGFELDEIHSAENLGVKPIWLGHRILRCETAPIVALSNIMLLTENL